MHKMCALCLSNSTHGSLPVRWGRCHWYASVRYDGPGEQVTADELGISTLYVLLVKNAFESHDKHSSCPLLRRAAAECMAYGGTDDLGFSGLLLVLMTPAPNVKQAIPWSAGLSSST